MLAMLTITLGLANSSLNLWLCSINLRSLSSCIVALLALAAADDIATGCLTDGETMKRVNETKTKHESLQDPDFRSRFV